MRGGCPQVQMGRSIAVQRASGKHAIFHFAELCETNVAAADYIALCGRFHTVALDGIPVFDSSNRPAAYRFVTLIDVLYEHRVRLLAAAAADPFSLFAAVITQADKEHTALTDFIVDDNLGFAKDRIISRLTEMQSHEYARAHAEYVPSALPLSTFRLAGSLTDSIRSQSDVGGNRVRSGERSGQDLMTETVASLLTDS
jgi:predicted ATPase